MPAPFPGLQKDFSALTIDLRAEVLGAEFIKHGIPADQLAFRTVGGFRRPIGKDVEDIQLERSENLDLLCPIRLYAALQDCSSVHQTKKARMVHLKSVVHVFV